MYAVVDDLFKRREPQRQAAGIYFVTPTAASIGKVVEDWQSAPTYGSAHIFFTSKVSPQHLAALRSCPGLLAKLRALAEVGAACVALAVPRGGGLANAQM